MGYKVQKGDGWYKIAKNTGIDVNELLKLNNATLNTVIHPGQEIKTKAQNNQSGLGKYVQGFTKEETSKTMPTPYKPGYTEQQFIRDNAKSIQQQLVKAGYDLGKYGENKDGVDGKWGKTSQDALDKALADGYRLDRGQLVSSNKPKSTKIQSNSFIPVGYQAGAVRHLQGQVTKSEPKKQSTFWQSMGSVPLGSYGAYSGLKTAEKPQLSEEESIKQNAENIQAQLKNAGYDLGSSGKNKNGVDGQWGPRSQAALEQAKKDGYVLQNGKLVSSKLATTANAFVPMGAQAMVQRGQTQAVSQPQLQTTGSAFYISYPEHPISTGGTPLKYITPTLPLGHSASIILDDNGNATYHTYGRYGNRGSYITKALPSMLKGESKQAYLERIRPHLEYADKSEPVKATYVSNVDSEKSRQYYKDEPQKNNYGFIIGSTCVGEACNGINAGRNFSKGELFQYITPNTPDLQHTLYGNETYHF